MATIVLAPVVNPIHGELQVDPESALDQVAASGNGGLLQSGHQVKAWLAGLPRHVSGVIQDDTVRTLHPYGNEGAAVETLLQRNCAPTQALGRRPAPCQPTERVEDPVAELERQRPQPG
jgi:hypothetical protein